jgi:hypothetical protein
MEITVWIERVEGNGYRARGVEPFGVTGEGATKEEAIQSFREQVEDRIASGAQVVQVTIPPYQDNPWEAIRGTWDENDPAIKRWEELVEEYRRQIDEDPSIP